jgi:hypothetical protein
MQNLDLANVCQKNSVVKDTDLYSDREGNLSHSKLTNCCKSVLICGIEFYSVILKKPLIATVEKNVSKRPEKFSETKNFLKYFHT